MSRLHLGENGAYDLRTVPTFFFNNYSYISLIFIAYIAHRITRQPQAFDRGIRENRKARKPVEAFSILSIQKSGRGSWKDYGNQKRVYEVGGSGGTKEGCTSLANSSFIIITDTPMAEMKNIYCKRSATFRYETSISFQRFNLRIRSNNDVQVSHRF